MGRAWWLLAPLLVACSSGTRIVLSVDAMPEVGALEALTLDVEPDGIGSREFALSSASLPGTVVIGVPDDERQVSLRLTGRAVDTRVWTAATMVRTESGRTVTASLMLGPAATGNDLSTVDEAEPDMSGAPADLTGADLTGVDLTAIPDLKPPPDLKPAVTYRRKITVTAGAALPAGYTIRVPLEANFLANAQSAGKLRVDRNDLRVRTVGGQERNRILDETPPGELPAVWFSLSSALGGAASVDYYLHYGAINPGVAPADGTAVFLVYDQFTGNTLANTWQSNGAPVVSAGVIRFRQNQMDAITTVTNPLPATACIEGRVRAGNPASTFQTVNTDQFWWWFGFQNNGSFAAADPWVLWIQRGVNYAQAEANIAGTTCAACTNMGGHTLDNQFHVYRVERNATSSVYYRDGVSSATYAYTNASPMAPLVRNYAVTSDLDMDWIRGRELRAPAPTVTLAAEEIVP